ncbi:PREDICTED: putative SOS response-associated peptidase YoqW [Theobroma cacao]|uniref:SOS response-associated peptidase YoqW n=1 Tax=Theobroma cacao TaxID=3641 RepID=A0AB32VLU9_THECC|nr:PREDICTED: putative SOS response-associated peptidase YoqW [Theobroma cacao]
MCGRARCTLRADDIPRASHRNDGPVRHVHMDRYRPSYNVGPGMNLPVVRRDDGSNGDGGVVLHCMKWGLIPSFTKKTDKPDFYKMFNARSESVCEKASFRRLLPKSRCLVAVEGFYEWKKDGSKKQPYYIHFKDGRPLVFAALYDCWENSEGEKLYTFTILTTASSSAFLWLHDRMPVILGDKESTDTWLNGTKIDTLLKPYENPDLVWYPVTSAIGKLSFEGPECVKEVPLKTQEKNPISKFFSTREVKREQESNMEKSLCDESVQTNLLKNLKEEPNSPEDKEIPSLASKGDNDSKSSVLVPTCEDVRKCQTKRDYEEFSADTKPAKDEIEVSPARKKGNIKGVAGKQPTLFAYFGKR